MLHGRSKAGARTKAGERIKFGGACGQVARCGAAAALIAATLLPAAAAETPAACPSQPTRVVHSIGGAVDYLGTVPGIPDLCHLRRADGENDYYFGVWRQDWPGAGQAYPAMAAVLRGPKGTRADFVTRSIPGMQWTDSFINEGTDSMVVDGHTYLTLKLAHERKGIEGNFYHSIITSWRDLATGITIKTVEDQIAGKSYGPATTWTATKIQPLP